MQTEQNHTSMDKAPFISFIIPVYDVPADILCECINSIMALSLRAYEREIIVVDDGSKTSPLAKMASFVDDIIYIRQKNGGVSTARNTGLRMASGQYIQFVDGDDLLLPIYEHVLDLARFEKADMVMFDFTNKNHQQVDYTDEGPVTGTELMHRQNIHGSAWGFIFKTNILGTLRFTPGIAYGEDEEFTPQLLLRAEHVYKTTAKAYFYRKRTSSATGNVTTRKKLQRLHDTKQVILRLHQKEDTLPLADRIALKRRIAQLTMDYIYNTMVLTRNRKYLDRQLEDLRREGLFPLPDLKCTTKYTWFRRMTNSKAGLTLLMHTLPLMTRER